MYAFQSPSSTISKLKQTISFNIPGSNVNNLNLVVKDISGKMLEEILFLRINFQRSLIIILIS